MEARVEPHLELYEGDQDRRRKRKEAYGEMKREFGARLTEETAHFQATHGRRLTHSELAAMLRERTGKSVTPRYVGRWYQGLAMPRSAFMIDLASILNVRVGWLCYGEGEREPLSRGVYSTDDGFYILDNRAVQIATVTVELDRANQDNIVRKCYELLDLISPARPLLQMMK